MHKSITRDTAVSMYKEAKVVIADIRDNGIIYNFVSGDKYVQINAFNNGNRAYFTQDLSDLVDDVMLMTYNDADNPSLDKGQWSDLVELHDSMTNNSYTISGNLSYIK